jgi:hypothetical protein
VTKAFLREGAAKAEAEPRTAAATKESAGKEIFIVFSNGIRVLCCHCAVSRKKDAGGKSSAPEGLF